MPIKYVFSLVLKQCLCGSPHLIIIRKSGSEVINNFSCSTRLSMEFFQLVNGKMPTIISRKKAFYAYLCLKNSEFLVTILLSI